ncbi:hypothetical protein C8R47DRAFT_979203 [Mycena vitilis]|nr:hypothetical protein C8R47DRAFT_979203 [Mycena vitilis]
MEDAASGSGSRAVEDTASPPPPPPPHTKTGPPPPSHTKTAPPPHTKTAPPPHTKTALPPHTTTAPPPPPPPRTTAPPPPANAPRLTAPPPRTTAPPPPANAPLPTSAAGDSIPPCPAEAKQWFKDVYKEITAKDLGDSYNAVLRLLIDLERVYRWEVGAVRGLSTTNRPQQVATWVNLGRGGRGGWISNGVGPPIESLTIFDDLWWKWWGGMQPEWRVADAGTPGRFTRDRYPTKKADWACLRHPGKNGFLTVVATLYWWGKATDRERNSEDRASWAEAVTDVKWILRGLLAAQRGDSDGGDGGTENETDQLSSE